MPAALSGSTIVTLTMNPALDITTAADVVRPTDKIRCAGVRYDAGGGGLNVARVAHELGATVSAVFPAGGPTGGLVTRLIVESGVPFRRIPIADSTRESFTVNEDSTGRQYRFVLAGPQLTAVEQAECLDQLRDAAHGAACVVASGSLPPGVPPDLYQRVCDICGELGVPLILDTSGQGLTHISSGIALLKASLRELRECIGRALATETDQAAAARELVERGVARSVVVSLGSEGAILVTSSQQQRFSSVSVPAVSGIGAGDAMVAAITVGLCHGWPLSKAVRYGIAAGAAMLTTPGTAACDRGIVDRLFELVPEPSSLPNQ
jgi:6-phosphofructokinase 2